jgi:hypothetical protein
VYKSKTRMFRAEVSPLILVEVLISFIFDYTMYMRYNTF